MPNMKTQTAAHTPKQGICPESSPELIRALKDILSHSYMPDAHTAFIVRAVNAHEIMYEALQACLNSEYVDQYGTHIPVIKGELRQQIAQAIAKAEGR